MEDFDSFLVFVETWGFVVTPLREKTLKALHDVIVSEKRFERGSQLWRHNIMHQFFNAADFDMLQEMSSMDTEAALIMEEDEHRPGSFIKLICQ